MRIIIGMAIVIVAVYAAIHFDFISIVVNKDVIMNTTQTVIENVTQ